MSGAAIGIAQEQEPGDEDEGYAERKGRIKNKIIGKTTD